MLKGCFGWDAGDWCLAGTTPLSTKGVLVTGSTFLEVLWFLAEVHSPLDYQSASISVTGHSFLDR